MLQTYSAYVCISHAVSIFVSNSAKKEMQWTKRFEFLVGSVCFRKWFVCGQLENVVPQATKKCWCPFSFVNWLILFWEKLRCFCRYKNESTLQLRLHCNWQPLSSGKTKIKTQHNCNKLSCPLWINVSFGKMWSWSPYPNKTHTCFSYCT